LGVIDAGRLRVAVDDLVVNPTGFLRRTRDEVGIVLSSGTWDREDPTLCSAMARRPEPFVALNAPANARHPAGGVMTRRSATASAQGLVGSLRDLRAVIDVPSLHASAVHRAKFLAVLCCAGVPTMAHDLGPEVRDLLGGPVVGALDAMISTDLSDEHARELRSIALRRAALATVSSSARQRSALGTASSCGARDTVSIVLVTCRREWIEHAIRQANAQTYPSLELVVVLHGERFHPDVEARVRRLARLPVTVLRAPRSRPLGAALNLGLAAASGRIVTRMDDDDYYDAEHVVDVVQAHRYSRATLVGKHAEFVYLAAVNMTIRQAYGSSERYTRHISGATMTIDREDILALGGFEPIAHSEDSTFIQHVVANGAQVYRAHGYGVVVNRHGMGHTWDVDTDHFLARATERWPGRDLAVAGVRAQQIRAVRGGA
jgi:hypothetical protein